ncbi:protein Simiate [Selaginella moellendorffii]|uniref:protein Simiate n=1 Tax=Selaginella moellendorffii TaxID=88036 RepID=UPI000D1CBFF1|nr:protein Simiate [Selaginella moellendorffii]|eukprot:XP_024530969.1 protein Simiate [Selaginella moellendorffii]
MEDKEEENAAVLALYPRAHELPARAPPAHETNFTHYFALDVGGKEFHDQYLYRHGNGLCVVGLAPSHLALRSPSKIKIVDYDVGKKSRADMKASGRRKKDAQVLEENSSLCKVSSEDAEFLVRCCIRGQLLEVNERLTSDPSLLSRKPASQGYIAILMPKPEAWKKAEKSLLTREQYKQQRMQQE